MLPTIGLVQGMYNDSAQIINSDGNNNLKVYVVNESGGGGGSGAIAQQSSSGLFAGVDNSGSWTQVGSQGGPDSTYSLLTGVAMTVRPDPSKLPGAGNFCSWEVSLMDASFTNIVAIGIGIFYQDDYSAPLDTYYFTSAYVPPIDCTTIFTDPTNIPVMAQANPGGIRIAVRLLFGV